jgi:hypothetical protein
MRLWKPSLQQAAEYYLLQLSHRKTAVETAIACVERAHAEETETSECEFADTIRDWVIETILQGAYLCEYHIWEKDVKEYFNKQRDWNGNHQPFKWNSKLTQSFIDKVQERLIEFSAVAPPEISAIERMRTKTNIAKHDPGLLVEHFVTQADYDAAVTAIEAFWDSLVSQQAYRR